MSLIRPLLFSYRVRWKSPPGAKNCPDCAQVGPALLEEDAEKALAEALETERGPLADLVAKKDYVAAAQRFHDAFAGPVHAFFDQVFVSVDDVSIRNNRLALLRDINSLFAENIADLSEIVEADAK